MKAFSHDLFDFVVIALSLGIVAVAAGVAPSLAELIGI